ncbi:beta-galactosidase [Gracilibacillus sp. YIM 98692]|uniref:beta-galactosidase n=1 Tax=Gracilibacillus sp. YIM 98692 TaxID=2663532 RepID=UPI0013D2FA19|nr:beta-galactosidase [Gracilibacillus sp. YIM 98692]
MIKVKDQSLVINGESVMIFGGELHYFRVPKSEWRNRIKQMKEAGMNMVSTYIPWVVHEYEEGKIDVEGNTREERDLVTFLNIVQEENMYCLVRPGPYVMAEVVDHGVPTWFIENYPESLAKTADGEIHPTRVVSYMHPTYLEKVDRWYQFICRVLAPYQIHNGGSVILFQLDNEVGMFHWVTNNGDYNEETQRLFVKYLEQKYSLEEFNQLFHVNADNINQFVSSKLTDPDESHGMVVKNEFSYFMRIHYRQYIEYLQKLADNEGIKVPFVVNIHGFDTIDIVKRGTKYPIGISQLQEAAKIDDVLMAGDYYIGNIEYDNYVDIVLANAFTKAIQWKEQPLFSAEFQGGSIPDKPRLQPSSFDLTTRLCVANGMNAVNYYMFVGGENYKEIGLLGKRHEWQAALDMNGRKRPHYKVIQHLGSVLSTYNESLAQSKPDFDTHFAFNPEYYMTEFSNSYTVSEDQALEDERETNMNNGIARGLRQNNIIYEGYNLLNQGDIDVSEVPTLWLFSHQRMSKQIQEKLIQYMEDGGQLVMFPVIPTKDMNNEPCTILKDYIGVSTKSRKKNGFVQIDDVDSIKVDSMETYDINHGAFGWSEDENKEVVAFEKTLGKGKLVMFGISMEHDYQYKDNVYINLAAKVNVKSSFQLNDEVDISTRLTGYGQFLFLTNFDEYEKETTIQYKDHTLFNGNVVTVPGKSGLILPVNISLTDELLIKYSTAEIFHLKESKDQLLISVKAHQPQEQMVIQSDKWIPIEQEHISIEEMNDENEYKITITETGDESHIAFCAK